MDTIVKDYKYNPRANRLCSMMRAKDDLPQDVSESVETLDQALQDANYITARKLTTELTTSSELDTVLELLARYAKSQPQATELLVEVLDATGTVRRFAAGALLDQTAVDDVSQDALISIADSVDSYDGRSKVTTWVHTIVRRRVVDHLRRQRSTVPLEDHDMSPAARMSSIIATRATVHEALEALPDLYKVPVVLRDIEGHAYAKIAERLDRPEGTIKAQIARGRAMVAAHLRDTGVTE